MLLGPSGAGKTTVAPLVAQLLGCPWCDLDQRIAAAAHQSINEIFAGQGEAHFRDLERQAMGAVLDESPQVIATGGGWAGHGDNLAGIAGGACTIYLSVSASVAAQRLADSSDRPMLAGGEANARWKDLLARRGAIYRRAEATIVVDELPAESVAAAVANVARAHAGW